MIGRVEITTEPDIVLARQLARKAAIGLGFSLIDQTRITTAVSELARNTFLYAGRGTMECWEVAGEGKGKRKGLQFIFHDQGPGIADVELAMTVGFTSGSGLGLGLSGARRLMDEFSIDSRVGQGTVVRITKWLTE
ncbi:anti-sigma regulatory factor [Heliobacterium gestii]|uniref:Anti-sigma regulatory factor n=1 Tax=Heliomicrobium gestii TaxID=2699 RepID=A0A845L780_HELGE|nr:anti-sigma regulatory factor [Heliomicrobium gestii]MBM7865847.1 serine/threonine-protein kinase RsbT [Heliomicrobium gestii]MZP42088.1 anti-sigma regulatory factor [Heliomicrobium gestii]